jgi:hypothetical protein
VAHATPNPSGGAAFSAEISLRIYNDIGSIDQIGYNVSAETHAGSLSCTTESSVGNRTQLGLRHGSREQFRSKRRQQRRVSAAMKLSRLRILIVIQPQQSVAVSMTDTWLRRGISASS